MKRDMCLRRLSALQFAMWETRIYLDTHPCDEEAKEMLKNYREKFDKLRAEYEKEFGPLTLNGINSDEWLKDPWPWDNECCE